jgi:hypothetical protein
MQELGNRKQELGISDSLVASCYLLVAKTGGKA